MEDRDTVLARLSVLLKIPMRELEEALERVPPDSFRPVRVRRGLTLEEVTKVEERKLELPGVVVEVEPQRVYPTSTFAAEMAASASRWMPSAAPCRSCGGKSPTRATWSSPRWTGGSRKRRSGR